MKTNEKYFNSLNWFEVTDEERVSINAFLMAAKKLYNDNKDHIESIDVTFGCGGDEAISINKIDDNWQIYFIERGNVEDLYVFLSIDSAIIKLISRLPFTLDHSTSENLTKYENELLLNFKKYNKAYKKLAKYESNLELMEHNNEILLMLGGSTKEFIDWKNNTDTTIGQMEYDKMTAQLD